MAFNAGAIQAALNLNFANFASGLQNAVSAARNAGNTMRTAFNGAAGSINQASSASNALNNNFKDMQRIVGGILISQAFYRAANAIQDAASSVFQFSGNMEKATIAMEYFVGTQAKAEAFVTTMKEFAAQTPFATEQALELSRRLMSMGFAYDSVKGVMGIMTDAAAATGGTAEQMNRVVLALGQMKTNGYIAGQELRQLAEAGIPAYKILKEELGLTADQLRDIGRMKIDGDLGVGAILTGLEKRYKGAADRIAETVPGMFNTIKDDFLIVSDLMYRTAYQKFGGFIRNIRDGFELARRTLTRDGMEGLLKAFVPEYLQQSVRSVAAALQTMGEAFRNVYRTVKPVATIVGGIFLKTLGLVLPPIALLARSLTSMTAFIMETVPAVKILAGAIGSLLVAGLAYKSLMFLWTVTRMGLVCAVVARAVTMLSRAIQLLWVAMVGNKIVRVVVLVSTALIGLAFASQTAAAWLDRLMAKVNALSGKTLGKLFGTGDGKSVSDQAGQFNKQIAEMQKNLKDVGKNAEKTGKKVKDSFVASFDELYQIPDNLDKVGEGLEDIKAGDFDMGLDEGLLDSEGFIGPPIPDNLDDLIGGGPPNKAGGSTPNSGPSDKEGKGGGMIDPPNLAPVTQAFATVNTLLDGFRAKLEANAEGVTVWATKVNNAFNPVKVGINDLITTADSGIKAINPLAQPLIDTYANAGKAITDTANVTSQQTNGLTTSAYESFSTWSLNVGRSINTWSINAISDFLNWSVTTTSTIDTWVSTHATSLGNWGLDIGRAINTWSTNAITAFANWSTTTGTAISTWVTTHATALNTWGLDIGKSINTWSANAITDFAKWSADTGKTISTWSTAQTAAFTTWVTNVKTNIGNWAKDVGTIISTWSTSTYKTASVWLTNTSKGFYDWGVNTGNNFVSWAGGMLTVINSWATSSYGTVSSWISSTSEGVASWAKSAAGSMVAFANSSYEVLSGWAGGAFGIFNNWLAGTSNNTQSWAGSMIDTIVGWARSAWAALAALAGAVGKSIGNAFNFTAEKAKNAWSATSSWASDNKSWLVPAAIGTAAIVGTALVVGSGGFAAPALVPAMAALGAFAAYETGGIVDKDQLARIGEGNRREAIIPLENSAYMKPFSAAVANDLLEMLGEGFGGQQSSQPDMRPILYVANVIADDRGLKELERRLEVIRLSEQNRKGL